MMDKTNILGVLDMIETDAEMDILNLEGQPFDGKSVAEMFGKQAAMIKVLAKLVRHLVQETL